MSCVFVLGCATAGGREQPIDADPNDAPVDTGIDANLCVTQPCDILTKCGCATGMSCDIDGSDAMGTACRAVSTPGKETNTCGSPSGCDVGYVCLNGANNGQGFCKRYCSADTDCVQPRGKCVTDILSGGMPIAGIPSVCTSNCDPVNVAASGQCPAAHKCGIFSNTHAGVTQNIVDCAAAGVLAQGGNCKVGAVGQDNLCAADHLCTTINAGTNFNCRRICNRGLGNTNCPGLTCIAFNPALTVAGVEYGVCN